MAETSLEREIGRLEAQVENLEIQQAEMNDKLDTVIAFMQSAKGSWKALCAMGALSSAITASVIKLWTLLAR